MERRIMTWIYTPNSVSSPGTPGSRSDCDSLASTARLSATSNKTPTVSPSYKPVSERETSTTPLYGMTSKPLTGDRGTEPTSSPQDSPANHTVWQGVETSTTTETSGPIHSGSLAKWHPDSSCWRTYQVSMWAMLDGQLTGEPWSGNFPNWGTMRNGELIPLSKPEPLTVAEDGGPWHIPTPSVSDVYIGNLTSSQQSLDNMHSVSLPNFVERYPEGLWATPTVNNSKNNAGPSQMDRHGPALDVQVTQWPTLGAVGNDDPSTIGNVLSADWVEWLMGIPQGWTDKDRATDYNIWLAAARMEILWMMERGLPRTVPSQENRVSRLKMLGNGIVPSTVQLAIKELSSRLPNM